MFSHINMLRSEFFGTFSGLFSTFSTRAIYGIYSFFVAILIFDYFSDTQKYNYVMILVGVLLLCTIGNFILSSGSLYLERVNEKYVFLYY